MEAAKIIHLFCEILGVDEDGINETTKLMEENGFEPIDIARLVIASEETFRITIHDEDVASFQNVGHMVDYIQKNLPGAAFSPEQLIYETSQSIAWKERGKV